MTRILIAEDSPTQAEKLRLILESEGFLVDVAVDAQDGLAQFQTLTPDLVISDVLMPGMTGYEFCAQIKRDLKGKRVPVILLSTLSDPMDIIRGLECEADNFITKPYEPEQLVARIRTVLQNREIRSNDKLTFGVEIVFLGKKFVVTSAKEQILDLLIATFEDIVRTNSELKRSKAELATAKLKIEAYAQELERRVQERTAELLEKQHQLHHAQKMEALGQLTGGLAHDFNNMLTIVIGNLDTLASSAANAPNGPKLVETALEAACRGAELTHQLLAFSRKQQLASQLTDVNELAGGMVNLLGRTLGEAIEIAFEPAPDLWSVVVDPALMRSAIANLATNARDAMPKGGKLAITTRNASLDASDASDNGGIAPGDFVHLTVSDTGTGMSAETVARVFEPFFTTKPEGKGTGLGLSMVFGFIQQSGGHIRIDSAFEKGTAVHIFLPRAAATAAEKVADSSPGSSQLSRSHEETILVVEDNPGVRETVIRQLKDLGYRVIEADGAAAAITVLNRAEPVDLLFTDIIMPGGKTGRDLAREARSIRPDLKVLFTSGYRGAGAAEADELDSQSPFVAKPYRLRELAERIRDALDQKTVAN